MPSYALAAFAEGEHSCRQRAQRRYHYRLPPILPRASFFDTFGTFRRRSRAPVMRDRLSRPAAAFCARALSAAAALNAGTLFPAPAEPQLASRWPSAAMPYASLRGMQDISPFSRAATSSAAFLLMRVLSPAQDTFRKYIAKCLIKMIKEDAIFER